MEGAKPMSDDLDLIRALPHSVMAEKSVLSAMLMEPLRNIPICIENGLKAASFYDPGRQTICGEILGLYEKNKEVEPISFTQHLLDKGLLDRVGGAPVLQELMSYAVGMHEARLVAHVRLILDKATLRGVIFASNTAIQEAYDNPDSPQIALESLETSLGELRRDAGAETTLRHASEDVEAIAKGIMGVITGTAELRPKGIETGFVGIDDKTRGVVPCEMFVLAARPSVGKTALMMNIVEKVAVDSKIPTFVISAEMTRDVLMSRLIFGRAKIDLKMQEKPKQWEKGGLLRFQKASSDIKESPLWVDDRARPPLNEIRAKARRLHHEHGIKFIAIDYLQLIRHNAPNTVGSREREVAEISAGLKALAKELNVGILVLAQLNRQVETRTGKDQGRPKLSDLRESGSLEQDADVVGLLYRADYGKTDEEAAECAGVATLSIAKNRNGETGDVPLTFIKSICRFESGHPVTYTPPQERPRKGRFDDD